MSRLLPASLRARLAMAIALITIVAVGLSFVAVYRGTVVRLRDQIDAELRTQVAEWEQFRAGADISGSAALRRTAQRFIAAQRYHPASRVLVFQVRGGAPVSNESEILERELELENDHDAGGSGLLDAPDGLSTASVEQAGQMRVLSAPISASGTRVGTLHVADPLKAVEEAQSSLLRTFALVGSLAVLLAIAAGVWIATLIARPLRRMADVAAAVDAGDLSRRAGTVAERGEVGVLAQAFDHMLERLERAFARQRDFVSDASHELRTPLAVLRAQVELLDHEHDERARHEATATLLRRLDEMDRLVSDMLTLASAEAGRLVEPEPIDLDDFFEDLRRDLPAVRRARLPRHRGRRDARGGPRPPDPGAAQPRAQRGRPHRARRSRQRASHAARRPAGHHRQRHGDRDPPGAARADLRALPSRRGQPLARPWRKRPGPGHRARDRGSARRADPRGIPAGAGHDDRAGAARLRAAGSVRAL